MIRTMKKSKRTWKELASCPPTVCAKGVTPKMLAAVSPELVKAVRERVSGYLPGMEDATLAVTRQRNCHGEDCQNQCSRCDAGAKNPRVAVADKIVFTMSKSAEVSGKIHEQVVKVTVDDDGRMCKLTVSK
jgi:hypothetical protein